MKYMFLLLIFCSAIFAETMAIKPQNMLPSQIAIIFGQPYLVGDTLQVVHPTRGALNLPEGITSMMGCDHLSAVIVQGTPDGIKALKDMISLIDVAPKQINIEAKLLTLSSSEMANTNLTWSVTNGTEAISGGKPTGQPSSVMARTSMGGFSATMNALSQHGVTKSVLSQQVMAMNGIPASISFGQNVPVLQPGTTIITPNATIIENPTIELVPVMTSLNVIARVVGRDRISMILFPEIQEITGWVETKTQRIPVISKQTYSLRIDIRSGEQFAVAGLTRSASNRQRISFFGTASKENTESILFITPTILVF